MASTSSKGNHLSRFACERSFIPARECVARNKTGLMRCAGWCQGCGSRSSDERARVAVPPLLAKAHRPLRLERAALDADCSTLRLRFFSTHVS
jgi:hypothetical protein